MATLTISLSNTSVTARIIRQADGRYTIQMYDDGECLTEDKDCDRGYVVRDMADFIEHGLDTLDFAASLAPNPEQV